MESDVTGEGADAVPFPRRAQGFPRQPSRSTGPNVWASRSALNPRILGPWTGSASPEGWVGRFRIDLVNGRGWPASPAELQVRRETVHLRHELVEVAVMVRTAFADWLAAGSARPLVVGKVDWTLDLGALVLTVGHARYRLTDEARRQVVMLV
jgi:hypothetical protein